MALPAVDAVVAGTSVFDIGYAVYVGDSKGSVSSQAPIIFLAVARMALFLASAGVGGQRVNECRERLAIREEARQRRAQRAAEEAARQAAREAAPEANEPDADETPDAGTPEGGSTPQ